MLCTTGFPKKFSKLKNIPDQLSDDREGEIIENVDFKYSSNGASFMGNPVPACPLPLSTQCRNIEY